MDLQMVLNLEYITLHYITLPGDEHLLEEIP